MLSLRASNEGLPRPRVARAQEHDRHPRFIESFLLPERYLQQRLYLGRKKWDILNFSGACAMSRQR